MQEILAPVSFSADAVEGFLCALKEHDYRIHALMIARSDTLCYASAAAPYTLQTPHRLFSAAKSILMLNSLFAIQEGKMKLTDRVVSFFPEIPVKDPLMQRMTLRDLLTMQTGQVEDPFGEMINDMDADLVRLFFQAPVVDEPGTVFRYNNTVPHMIAAVTERAVQMPIELYQNMRLCQPLNAPIHAPTNKAGIYNPVITCMSAESFFKYAMFFLTEGQSEGKVLLHPSLVREAVSQQVNTGLPGNSAGYGYQIWRNQFGGYRMDGGWGQFAFILPEENTAVVMLSDMTDASYALTAFEQWLLPAIRAGGTNAPSRPVLLQSMAPEGKAEPCPAIFDRLYELENNDTLRLEQSGQRLLLHVTGKLHETTITIGLQGMFCANQKRIVSRPTRSIDNMVYGQDEQAVLLSGAWVAPNRLEICGKSFAEMGEYRHCLEFDGQALRVTYMPTARHGMAALEDGNTLKGAVKCQLMPNC